MFSWGQETRYYIILLVFWLNERQSLIKAKSKQLAIAYSKNLKRIDKCWPYINTQSTMVHWHNNEGSATSYKSCNRSWKSFINLKIFTFKELLYILILYTLKQEYDDLT